MFGRRAQQGDDRIVHVSECMVRLGITQRGWLVELAKSLAQLGVDHEGAVASWASGLQSLYELDLALDMALHSPGSVVVMSAEWVGDSKGEPADSDPLTAPGIPEPPRDHQQLELYCEELGMRAISWIVAALQAQEGALVPGEANEAVVARLALRSLGSFTVSYAFGSWEKNIVVDALCGADVRERLDRLVLRVIDLPGLQWWSEEFDPGHYVHHVRNPNSGAIVAGAGSAVSRPRGLMPAREDRAIVGRIKAIDKEYRDLPRIENANWFPASQFSGDAVQSFRSTDPEWLAPTRAELAVELAYLVADSAANAIEERYVDELARHHTAVCTEQFLGDDAGDRPLRALVRRTLPAGERRIWTIHSGRDWTTLVIRFPMVLVPTGASDSPETWGGDAHGTWVTVDWEQARREYDAVHLSVLGSLDAAYVPLRVGIPGPRGERECWTMMTGWVPGSVLWLNDPLGSWPEAPEWNYDDVQREYEEALARLTAAQASDE